MKQSPFTKQELIDYIAKREYTADTEAMWLWYEKTEFYYVQGKLRIPLKNWKADVNLKLRSGKFGAKRTIKPKPLPEPQEEIKIATPEQIAELRKKMGGIGRKPNYGFRSNAVFEQRRQQAIKKHEDSLK